MAKKGGGTFEGARGGDLLKSLAGKLKAPVSPPSRPAPPPPPKALSVEEELLEAFQSRPPPPMAKPTPVKVKAGTKKEILGVPRDHMHKMIAAMENAVPQPTTPKTIAPSQDMGEAAFRRIAKMHLNVETFSASHDAPLSLKAGLREIIDRKIALGASKFVQLINPDDGYFIGYDFGTSTTKVVLRHPYRTGASFAVSVPRVWASGAQPHLWPTKVWYDPNTERFSPLPEEGWRTLQGFKSALIESLGHRTCCGAPSVTMTDAAAAFVACHLAYVVGTALERHPDLKIAGINIGVPVATLADARAKAMFDKAVRIGLALVPSAGQLTKGMVRAIWDAGPDPIIPASLHPELSGAIAGYCTAPRYYLGGHMIIDCGSATLDMASFTLANPQWPVGIYAARVEPLGADACLNYQAQGATIEECRKASRYMEFEVFRDTLAHMRVGFAKDRGKYPYQIILIGGGIHSEVHMPLFDQMQTAFHRSFHLPELMRDLDYEPGAEPGRLILADGLARDPIELREVAMPPDRPTPPSGPYSEMITKDQV